MAAPVQQTLHVCIVGPKRKVVKDGLSSSDETDYGSYDPSVDTEFELLGLPAGESIDDGSVSVVLRDVYGRYAQLSGGDVIETTSTPNEISFGVGVGAPYRLAEFDDGTSSYERVAALGERDVKVGDWVKVVHEGGDLWTRVSGLVQEQVDAAADVTDVNDSINPATQAASFAQATIEDQATGRTAAHYGTQDSAYTGDLAQGQVSDVYTLEITKAGALGTAEFSVTSTGGDNASGVVTPVDNATAVPIGANGLEILMDDADGAFVLGEKWTLTVAAAYTQKTLSIVTDSYDGLVDTVYQIKVVKGGLFADSPKVSVTTNNNIDSSTAVPVTADEVDIQLGTLGPVVEFDNNADPQGGLRLGDIYNVIVTAAKDDGARTLQLEDPIPTDDGAGGAINASGYDLSVSFYVKQASHSIPAGDYPDTGDLNWTAGDDTVTLRSGVEITDASVLDGTGDLLSLPVERAEVSIYYTAVLALEANRLGTLSSQTTIPGILGDVVPENDVAYGADAALANSAGVPIYYITTSGDSEADYLAALSEAEKDDDIYFMVPMSQDLAIQDLFKSHAISMSSEDNGLERVTVVSRTVAAAKDLYTVDDDDNAWTGYVAAGPELSPAQYRKVTIPGATFITDGVQPGDTLRTNFSIAASGEEVFETYTIESVTDQENLLIAAGPDGPVGSAGNLHRIEVVHPYTSQERAELAAAQSEFFGDRRVTNIFPDEAVAVDGETVPGNFLAAAYAGLKSSVAAHQGITNTEISGFLGVPQSLSEFTREELNEIAGGGTAIIAQAIFNGPVYVRHQLTTDMTDVNHQELSVTTNVDAISKYLRSYIKPLIGQYNITPEFLIQLETLTRQRLDFLIQETQTLKAGPQIVEIGNIVATQDPLVRTKILMTLPIEIPYAANNIVTKIVVV